jgi:transmembrane sensor
MDIERDPIHLAAAEWLTRLQEPALSLADTMDWQRWMAADVRHADAFRRLEELWHRVAEVSIPLPSATDGTDSYDASVPVGDYIARSRRAHLLRRLSARRALAVAASLLFVAVGLTVVSGLGTIHALGSPRATVIETAVGQNRTVRLADGSSVTLGGHSRIDVFLRPALRQVTLSRGEALFNVAKDPSRPFQVRVGMATVTAVGTEFNVRRGDERVVVSVLEGRVLVQPVESLAWFPWVPISMSVDKGAAVNAGHSTVVDHGGIRTTRALPNEAGVIGWQHGKLAFEAAPLHDVVEDVNRYSKTPITIADEQTGDLLITGTVTNNNVTGWVASLVTTLGIRAEVLPDRIVLRQN